MSIRRNDEACSIICDCCGVTESYPAFVSAQEMRRVAQRGSDRWAAERKGSAVWDFCGACQGVGHSPAGHPAPRSG